MENYEAQLTSHVVSNLIVLEEMGIKPRGIIACTGDPDVNKAIQPLLDDIHSHFKAVDDITSPA